MTKLTYMVNGVEYASYSKALAATNGGQYKLHSIYTPVRETVKVDPEKRAKRVAAILAKAKEKNKE